MAGDWNYMPIGEVAEKVGMGPFGSSIKVSTFVPSGVPVISGQHLHGSRLQDKEYNYITVEHAQKLSSANVFRGDVIFTHAGNIGQVAYIPDDSQYDRYVISQRQFFMRCDRQRIMPEFVTAYFKTAEGHHRLLANSSPSGVPSLAQPVTYLRSLTIPVPPLPEQQAIAYILGSLDDKIELNRRRSRTLEEMTRAIFQSWFVDFDPVRAKAAGQPPTGLTLALADLFPDRLEESLLGLVPAGWRIGTLGDITLENRDAVLPSEIDPETPYIALEHIPKRSLSLDQWGVADGIASGKLRFSRGDILFGKLRPYFHKVGPAPVDGVCSTDIVVAKPRRKSWYGLVLAHMSSDAFVAHTDRGSTGTKMPRTNWRDMSRYVIVVPDETLAEQFTRVVVGMTEQMQTLNLESRTLAALRDALLPKLISGELRIADTERIVGGCI